ncbi:MAG: lysophospholipid acyltransferase family protein [bacterium]
MPADTSPAPLAPVSRASRAMAAASRKSRPLYRFAQFLVSTYCRLCHGLTMEGLEHVPATGGLLVIANHQSHLDPPLLGSICPRPIQWLAKAELFNKPFLSWLLPEFGQVPVAREAGGGETVKTAVEILKQGLVLGVFPEGSRSRDGARQKAKTGAVAMAVLADVPLLPIYISGTRAAMPPGATLPIPGRKIHVRIGPPFRLDLPAEALEDVDRREAEAEAVLDRVFALAPGGTA